ncbi:MAG: hypothetical protein Q8L29_01040 [archaeon]|nr:hypothetical protein [archaeon]
MNDILENAKEFLASAEDNIKKERYNASVSDFFKAIVTFCDYLLYKEIKILPKNHNERFDLLKTHFKEIYQKVIALFKKYRESYNLRLSKEDALELKSYAYEIKNFIGNKN